MKPDTVGSRLGRLNQGAPMFIDLVPVFKLKLKTSDKLNKQFQNIMNNSTQFYYISVLYAFSCKDMFLRSISDNDKLSRIIPNLPLLLFLLALIKDLFVYRHRLKSQ